MGFPQSHQRVPPAALVATSRSVVLVSTDDSPVKEIHYSFIYQPLHLFG